MTDRATARRVVALLGPTNTGKTHRAIERMLRHPSGMFGLPLRLLAREVYERVAGAVGADAVALVTGEEKILPADPRYWVCTVEAMPLDRRVSFVAVDEVQLAGDRQRGHVFTDRILHTRGLVETVFLGSETMAPLLTELVPGLEIERAERFSTLTCSGPVRLSRLPARSAVVAFSAEAVYELAERLKALHGGTAVVLGALSPRTRNAQVAMYQAGEVKHLVATDAIGMGLNLDLRHVALAALRKYDGRSFRDLSAAEIAQIAGRAGRFRAPGTFGTVRPVELPQDVADDVEAHAFPAVRTLFWRNTRLDFADLDALAASLERGPPHPSLVQVRGEDDQHVLATLSRDPEVRARVRHPGDVERLWEVCQVPDFRKTLTDAHVHLLRELALHLLGDDGVLPPGWVDERIARLDRVDGDIETLMGRIAWIRTWTYVTYRRDWVGDPVGWQERTRAIEDRLSDALHVALTARFVDRHAMVGLSDGPLVVEDGRVRLGDHALGRVDGFDFVPEGLVTRASMSRVRSGLASVLADRLDALECAPDAELELDASHRALWRGGALATLEPGPDRFEPRVQVHRLELLAGPDKDRVRARVERWVVGTVARLLAPLRQGPRRTGPVGGILYRLERGMGSIPRSDVDDELAALTDEDRRDLARRGVRVGIHTLYVPRTLKPDLVRIRARLYAISVGAVPTLRAPDPSRTAVRADGDAAFWEAIGFPPVGGIAVRADVLESVSADVRQLARAGPFPLPVAVMSRLALGPEESSLLLAGLGCRLGRDGSWRGPPRRRGADGGRRG